MILGHTWFYAMKVFTYSIFRVISFPRQEKIFTIDQLDYCTPYLWANTNTNMPFVGDFSRGYESIGVGQFKDPSLMGTFPLLASNVIIVTPVNMIYSITSGSLGSYYPWVVPYPS